MAGGGQPVPQGSVGFGGASATPSFSYPASVQATDLCLVAILWSSTTVSLTPPTGWTSVTGSTTASGPTLSLWIGYCYGGTGATSFAFSAATRYSGGVYRISAADQSLPIAAVAFTAVTAPDATATTHVATDATLALTTPNTLLLHVFGDRGTSGSATVTAWSTPTGCSVDNVTATATSSASGTNPNTGLLIARENWAGTGTTTARSSTVTYSVTAPTVNITAVVAIQGPATGAETLTTSETPAAGSTRARAASDSTTASDAVASPISQPRSVADNVSGGSDAAAWSPTYVRAVSDSAAGSDAATQSVSAARINYEDDTVGELWGANVRTVETNNPYSVTTNATTTRSGGIGSHDPAGTQAVRVMATAAGLASATTPSTNAANVTAGQAYVVGGWASRPFGVLVPVNARVGVDWRDSAGSLVRADRTQSVAADGAAWYGVRLEAVCPVGATKAYAVVEFDATGSQAVFFDDISLRVPPAAAANVAAPRATSETLATSATVTRGEAVATQAADTTTVSDAVTARLTRPRAPADDAYAGEMLAPAERSFEAGVAGWTAGTNATIATSGAVGGRTGAQALQVTATVAGVASARSAGHAVTGGALLAVAYATRDTVAAQNSRVGVDWYDAGAVLIRSDRGPSVAADNAGWYRLVAPDLVAPGNAASGVVVVEFTATTGVIPVYFDDVSLRPAPARVAAAVTGQRAASDTAAGTDSATRLSTAYARPASETTTTSDAPAAGVTAARAVADASGGTDATTSTTTRARTVVETLSATADTPSRGGTTLPRAASDGSSVSDAATRAATAYTRAAADAVSTGSAAALNGASAVAVSESLTTADAAGRVAGYPRAVPDVAPTPADGAVAAVAYPRPAAEQFGISALAARALAAPRGAVETQAASDGVTSALGLLARDTTDTVDGGDTVAAFAAFPRSAADVVASGDVASRVLATPRPASDGSGGSDSTARLARVARTSADSGTAADAAVAGSVSAVSAADAAGAASDIATRRVLRPASAADSVPAAADVAAVGVALVRPVLDVTDVADGAALGGSQARDLSESLTTSDNPNVRLDLLVTAFHGWGVPLRAPAA